MAWQDSKIIFFRGAQTGGKNVLLQTEYCCAESASAYTYSVLVDHGFKFKE
jgi:hypothetical protein